MVQRVTHPVPTMSGVVNRRGLSSLQKLLMVNDRRRPNLAPAPKKRGKKGRD